LFSSSPSPPPILPRLSVLVYYIFFPTCFCSVDTWFLASSLTNRSTVIAIWFTIIIFIRDIRGLVDKTYCYNLLFSNGYIFLTLQHDLQSIRIIYSTVLLQRLRRRSVLVIDVLIIYRVGIGNRILSLLLLNNFLF
jgi:hypothetical protein